MKTYQETIDFLFSQLPQFQKIGQKAYKANLNNIEAICSFLGNPEKQIKTIHVAGSNGKGSTSHMLASVLQEAGYKVGLYTSPHLVDFRERIKINGEEITEQKVIEFVEEFQPKLAEIRPSFFEWTVGLAFYHFKHQGTDINVIETGLGGRLDSTNVIEPIVSVITNISLEHTTILGDTLELIATEKAGIIKPNCPVVIGKTQIETKEIFTQKALENKSNIYFADTQTSVSYKLDLKGEIQQENARTATTTCSVINSLGFPVSESQQAAGLQNVIKNTRLQGRFQVVNKTPLTVFDTAHNPDGIRILCNEISKINPAKIHVVIGMASDKNHKEMFFHFPKQSVFYFCSSTNERVLKGVELEKIAHSLNKTGTTHTSVADGLEAAKAQAKPNEMIVVTGSNFIVADILS
ncbi:MAG: folylpolyglutamate synthase/dihydrofolate synthase family protein [Flavobacteriales bacterium]